MSKCSYHIQEVHSGLGIERRSLGFAIIQFDWFLNREENWDAIETRVTEPFATREEAEKHKAKHYAK